MRVILALLCASVIGVPPVLAQPVPARPGPTADADAFVGTWNGGGLSLTLQKTGAHYTGMATAAGQQYPLQAQVENGVMTGIYSNDRVLKVFQAAVEGDSMQLAADGTRFALQRQGAAMAAPVAPGSPGSLGSLGGSLGGSMGGVSALPGADAGALAATPQDRQIAELLSSSAWCSFTYNRISGTSRQERWVLSPDGWASSNTNAESYSSGPYGSVGGQTRGGGQGRWRVQQSMLVVSEDGVTWQPLPMQISQNSNGYPIVNVNGKEFSSCR
jgi:hypothetical protein